MGVSTTGKEELIGTVIKSSEFSGFEATKAFDGDYSTNWASGVPGAEWVGVDAGVAILPTVTDVEIAPESDGQNFLRMVGSKIQGGATSAFVSPTTYYTVPDPTSGGLWLPPGRRNRIPIASPGANRCYRYLGTGTGPGDGYASVAELRFIATAGSGATSRPLPPSISPYGGAYPSGSKTVTITSETTSASIYYTVGTFASPPADPTTSDTLYTAPFTQTITSSGVIIKAIASDATCSTTLSRIGRPAYFQNYAFATQDYTKPETWWYDISDGELVQAASGSPFYKDGTYYLFTVSAETNGRIDALGAFGVHLYTSTDGINYQKVGVNGNIIANPDWSNIDEFPRVQGFYCASTSKFVVWANAYKAANGGGSFERFTTTTDPKLTSTAWTRETPYLPSGQTLIGDHSLFQSNLSQYPGGWGMVWCNSGLSLFVSSFSSDFLSFANNYAVLNGPSGSQVTGEGCVAWDSSPTTQAIVSCNPSTYYNNVPTSTGDTLGYNVSTTTDPSDATKWSTRSTDTFYAVNPHGTLANNQPNYVFTPPGKSQPVLVAAVWHQTEILSRPLLIPINNTAPLSPVGNIQSSSWDFSLLPDSGPSVSSATVDATGGNLTLGLSGTGPFTFTGGVTTLSGLSNSTSLFASATGGITIAATNATISGSNITCSLAFPIGLGQTVAIDSHNLHGLQDGSSTTVPSFSALSITNNSNLTASTPSNFTLTPQGTPRVVVSWLGINANENLKVFRGPDAGNLTLLATVTNGGTFYLDNAVSNATQYFYNATAEYRSSGHVSNATAVLSTTPPAGNLATITVGSAHVIPSGNVTISATAFGTTGGAMNPQPSLTWSLVSGNGTINSSTGLFTAPASPETDTVRATSGSIHGDGTVNVRLPATGFGSMAQWRGKLGSGIFNRFRWRLG